MLLARRVTFCALPQRGCVVTAGRLPHRCRRFSNPSLVAGRFGLACSPAKQIWLGMTQQVKWMMRNRAGWEANGSPADGLWNWPENCKSITYIVGIGWPIEVVVAAGTRALGHIYSVEEDAADCNATLL